MIEYPKIEPLYNRDERTHKFEVGVFRHSVFEYLYRLIWAGTEKVDGTNIRIEWDGQRVTFGGRTENAQIPAFLFARLQQLFPVERFVEQPPMTLFGEGYGAKIQKGGGNYKSDGVDFVLFDVLVGKWWLEWSNIVEVARSLSIPTVPIVKTDTLENIEKMVHEGFKSAWGDFAAEGIVARPMVDLKTRAGQRVIVKLKTKDF